MSSHHRPAAARMPTTRWSLIVQSTSLDEEVSKRAIAHICESYWYPLYAFLRRLGADRERSQDVVQTIFLEMLNRGWLSRVKPEIGTFRSYLRGVARNALRNLRRLETCQPKTLPLEIDFNKGERRFLREPTSSITPESEFDRSWARALLRTVLSELQAEYQSREDGTLFQKILPYLARTEDNAPYDSLARELNKSSSAVKAAVWRLRVRYRNRIREHVAAYTEDCDVESEVRFLFRALAME